MLDLQTNKVIICPKFDRCKMTQAVLDHVEQITTYEGIKSLKLYNRKCKILIVEANNLLKGGGTQGEYDKEGNF